MLVVRIIMKTKIGVLKTKQSRLIILLNFVIFSKKKLTFIKKQELHNFNSISND